MDLGAPISYLTLEPGTPVLSSDGEDVGRVEHVLADHEADVFDGLVVDMRLGVGGDGFLRFADAPQVAELRERGVILALDAEQARRLPEPSANPAVMEADPEDAEPGDLSHKLRRAWDLISGNY